jgi:hypothetical protein
MKYQQSVILWGMLIALALGTSAAAQIAPVGEELAVASDRGTRVYAPAVAFADAGGALVAWEAMGRGVVGRRLDAAGAPAGREVVLAASDLPTVSPYRGPATVQRDPAVVALADGGFLVAWVQETQDVALEPFHLRTDLVSSRVMARRLGPTGSPLGQPMALNDIDLGLVESAPQVIRLSSGRLLVIWQANTEDGAPAGIYGRLMTRRGRPGRAAFRIDTGTGEPGSRPAAVAVENDGFLVAWQGCCDGDDLAVSAQWFEAGATPAGEPFRVNAAQAGRQAWPAVARTASGNLLVAWMSRGSAGSGLDYQVFGQVLGSDGGFVGTETALSRTGGKAWSHGAPALVGTETGFLVAWTVWGRHFPAAIHGAELDAAGHATGEVFALSSGPIGIQWSLSLVGDGANRFLAAWEGFSGSGHPAINSRVLAGPQSEESSRSVGLAVAEQ